LGKEDKEMISVYNIKPKFQKALLPLLSSLHKAGITANMLTLVAILLSAVLGVAMWFYLPSRWVHILIPACLLLRMALNALDGMMARTYNMQSKLGEILNELGDVISDLFIYLPLIKLPGVAAGFIIAFCILSILNEFAGVMAKIVSGTRRYDGPMGKSDRAFLVGLLGILYLVWPGIAGFINYIFSVALLLLCISTFTRVYRSLIPKP
jgi:CDP-diacylglycerol--glycerol-3-phosphate 3-phosphatidyltransferase